MTIKIAINGFGRIGRLVYRIAAARDDIEIVAVNDLVPASNLAYLLKYDSTHGRFDRKVEANDDGFTVDGKLTRCLSMKDPAALPWKDMGVDYVLESTGLFLSHDDAGKHLQAGARRVLLSAPTKTPETVPTFAYKVNHDQYDPEKHRILSNASCTTTTPGQGPGPSGTARSARMAMSGRWIEMRCTSVMTAAAPRIVVPAPGGRSPATRGRRPAWRSRPDPTSGARSRTTSPWCRCRSG